MGEKGRGNVYQLLRNNGRGKSICPQGDGREQEKREREQPLRLLPVILGGGELKLPASASTEGRQTRAVPTAELRAGGRGKSDKPPVKSQGRDLLALNGGGGGGAALLSPKGGRCQSPTRPTLPLCAELCPSGSLALALPEATTTTPDATSPVAHSGQLTDSWAWHLAGQPEKSGLDTQAGCPRRTPAYY